MTFGGVEAGFIEVQGAATIIIFMWQDFHN
jgi:hypothetical protein